MELNTQAVNAFWTNRSQAAQSADDAGLSQALADDQLSQAEFHTLKTAYLAQNPEGDFEAFLADGLDGKIDQQSSGLFRDQLAQLGATGSAVTHLDFEINATQNGYIGVELSALDSARLSASPAQLSAVQPATKAQTQDAIQQALEKSFQRVPDRAGESRHDLNQRLQNHTHQGQGPHGGVFYDGSDVVVIAFEGTGAFDPRRPQIMQEAADILSAQGLSPQDGHLYSQSTEALEARSGKEHNWSGLGVGPLNSLLSDPELQGRTQWLSFPSEEIEALSGKEAYKDTSFEEIVAEATGSTIGHTPGIQNALSALQDIQLQARAQGKNPKFVIVSHSSGGRSAVKFLEKAKTVHDLSGQRLQFPFVLTIDPVREAHEAIGEAAREILNKGTEHNMNRVRSGANEVLNFLWPGERVEIVPQRKVYPPTVGFDEQPESLYKPSNTGRFQSFYQRKDTDGLKLGLHDWLNFGIHGSPVAGAENKEVSKGMGSSGHGEIAYSEEVLEAFIQGLKSLE